MSGALVDAEHDGGAAVVESPSSNTDSLLQVEGSTRYGCGPINGTLVCVRDVPKSNPDEGHSGSVVGAIEPSGEGVRREHVLALLAEHLGEVVEVTGTHWYRQRALVGEHGSAVQWEPVAPGPDREGEVFVSVSQTACEQLGFDGVQALARGLLDLGFRASRFDIHYDDRERVIEPAGVRDAWKHGQVRSHIPAQNTEWWEKGDGGATFYMGKRRALSYIRVYNADPLHGEGTGVRWELESHRALAQLLFESYVGLAAESVGEMFWQTMRATVDFVDRPAGAAPGVRSARGDNCALLPWWSQLVGEAGRYRPKVAKPISALESKRRFVSRIVLPVLVQLHAADVGHGETVRGADLEWLAQDMNARAAKMDRRHWVSVPGASWPRPLRRAGRILAPGVHEQWRADLEERQELREVEDVLRALAEERKQGLGGDWTVRTLLGFGGEILREPKGRVRQKKRWRNR